MNPEDERQMFRRSAEDAARPEERPFYRQMVVDQWGHIWLQRWVLKSALLGVLAEADEMRACGWPDSSEALAEQSYQPPSEALDPGGFFQERGGYFT